MDTKTQKTQIIKESLEYKKKDLVEKPEKELQDDSKDFSKRDPEILTIQKLRKRMEKAIEDSNNGRLTEGTDLLAEIEKWH